jgi:hypothetical protein
MSQLFTALAIGSIRLRNRSARAACVSCGGCRTTPERRNLCALDS